MNKCVLGIDFGTLSARAVVVELTTGREVAQASENYPHGVMDTSLPCGTPLPPGWALQDPADYIYCLERVVPEAISRAGAAKEDIVGIGVDFTACTPLVLDESLTPLCFFKEFSARPHAYAKLWKHHAAQGQADKLNAIARARDEKFLSRFGGRISSESLFPKIMQLLDEDPEIYERCAYIMEAGDWIVNRLSGARSRSESMAGYKALWDGDYPDAEFLRALDSRLSADKLAGDILPIGARAGGLAREAAQKLGLMPGIAVAAANIDGHACVPAAGITEIGDMLMIIGTSACHITLGREYANVEGACGAVRDGVIPGYIGFELGQSCVGDHLQWFVDNLSCAESAHQELTRLAEKLRPGQSGLLALDWWNGNRSVLSNAELSGLLIGLTLKTKPHEIYRALMEGIAFGTRRIIAAYASAGVNITAIRASGGIACKNPLMLRILSDVTGLTIKLVRSKQSSALGSAIFAAVAALCYPSVAEAARCMGGVSGQEYTPIPENALIYDKLYCEYAKLHDYFGRGENPVMKTLRAISAGA